MACHPKQAVFAKRTLEKAEALADRFGDEALRLADMPTRLSEFDVAISCTASSAPIIGLGAIERSIKQRRCRPMFIVDLAVPRDVYLHTIDDLASIVKTNGEHRESAVVEAEAIVEHEVTDCLRWLKRRESVPLIRHCTPRPMRGAPPSSIARNAPSRAARTSTPYCRRWATSSRRRCCTV